MTDARKLLERCWDEWGSNTDEHDDPVTQELARDLRKFLDAPRTRAESDAKLLGEALEYTKGKLERTEEELRLARLVSARSLRMTALGALKDTLGLSGEVKPDGTIEVSQAEAERLVRDGLAARVECQRTYPNDPLTAEDPCEDCGRDQRKHELRCTRVALDGSFPPGLCVLPEGHQGPCSLGTAPPSPAEKLSDDDVDRCRSCGARLGDGGDCPTCNPNAFR